MSVWKEENHLFISNGLCTIRGCGETRSTSNKYYCEKHRQQIACRRRKANSQKHQTCERVIDDNRNNTL